MVPENPLLAGQLVLKKKGDKPSQARTVNPLLAGQLVPKEKKIHRDRSMQAREVNLLLAGQLFPKKKMTGRIPMVAGS